MPRHNPAQFLSSAYMLFAASAGCPPFKIRDAKIVICLCAIRIKLTPVHTHLSLQKAVPVFHKRILKL